MSRKTHHVPGKGRLALTVLIFAFVFVGIGFRLVGLTWAPAQPFTLAVSQPLTQTKLRPDIVDRKGRLLATDIKIASLYGDPVRIIDVDEAVEKVAGVLPGIDKKVMREKLEDKSRRFVWIKRSLTPEQQAAIHNLGLPGLEFVSEPHRVYPAGRIASHILGFVDVDNRGLSGIESYIDKVTGLYLPKTLQKNDKPVVQLSVDLGVQHVLRSELVKAMQRFRAKAAAALVLDVTSGEVIAMSSLPDFDPNHRVQALEKERFDRMTTGAFELGSVFKTVTTAMALDLDVATFEKKYDAREPIKIASYKIRDYHPQKRWLSVPEIFVHSSNIGAAKMALDVGLERHRAFLKRMGLLDPISTELGEVRRPKSPKTWRPINTITISYGHGISVAPIQFASAAATLVNGGYRIKPTFLYQYEKPGLSRDNKILKSNTSHLIRQLLRRNVVEGTGRNAKAPGFRVGGKTGTSEKVIKGRYSKTALLTSFLSVFPSDDPAYLVYVMLDEPQAASGTSARPTAGVNAAPLTARIIRRIGTMLGVVPQKSSDEAFDEKVASAY